MSLKISHRYPKAHAGMDEEKFDKDWLSMGRVVFRLKAQRVIGAALNRRREGSEFQGAILPNFKAPCRMRWRRYARCVLSSKADEQ